MLISRKRITQFFFRYLVRQVSYIKPHDFLLVEIQSRFAWVESLGSAGQFVMKKLYPQISSVCQHKYDSE